MTGSQAVGQTLWGTAGAWSGTAPLAYAYQWQHCSNACISIPGATGPAYAIVPADLGTSLQVLVTAANSAGRASTPSAPVGPIAASDPEATQVQNLLTSQMAPVDTPLDVALRLQTWGYRLWLQAPGAGAMTIKWYLSTSGSATMVLVASGDARFSRAHLAHVVLTPTAAGRQLVQTHRSLRLTALATFTPRHRQSIVALRAFTL